MAHNLSWVKYFCYIKMGYEMNMSIAICEETARYN